MGRLYRIEAELRDAASSRSAAWPAHGGRTRGSAGAHWYSLSQLSPVLLGPFEQGLVDGHVGPAGAGSLVSQRCQTEAGQRSSAAPLPHCPVLTHTPPPADSCTPGSGRQGAVDPAHRRPHLVLAYRSGRVGGPLPRVGPVPGVGDDLLQRVRSVGQAGCSSGPRGPPRSPGSPPEWRSARRRSGRAPPSIRSRWARS